MEKKKIIFLCIHNSARSQMAEAILKKLYGDKYEVYSAGSKPTRVHPLAIEAMTEIGIDISEHISKPLDAFQGMEFDIAVTVCDPQASCPFIPGAKAEIHREFDDPAESDDIKTFRRVRDEILHWIEDSFRDPTRLPISLPTSLNLV